MLVRILKPIGWAIFKMVFSVEYQGVENIPAGGAVIIAGNHPSYLDPVLVGLPVNRPIRFMAWDALFRIPLLGQLITALGAFPVDIRKGRGEHAYREALRILQGGEILGIFPEGQRSEKGPMGELRTGVARLAIEAGAPVVPVTIGGAVRAWPKYRLLPKPAKIVVRFHQPIRLDKGEMQARGSDRQYHAEIMEKVAESINRSLIPSLRSAGWIEKWYQEPPSNIRTYEWAPLIALVTGIIILALRGTLNDNWARIILPAVMYYLYLIADLMFIPPSRSAKWLRNSMPITLILFWHQFLTKGLSLPAGEYRALLVMTGLTVFFIFFYEDYFKLQKFVRGIVVSYYFSLVLLLKWPHGLGTFTSIIVFILIFAIWYQVRQRWLVISLTAAVQLAGLWLYNEARLPLVWFAALSLGVNIYLQTFVSIAYDIRRAGDVSGQENRSREEA